MPLMNIHGLVTSFCITLSSPNRVISISNDIDELLGFNAEDFLTGKVSLQKQIHADDHDIADMLFSTEQNQNSTAGNTGNCNIRLRQSDGHIRCVKVHYTKSPDNADEYTILQLQIQDSKSIKQPLSDQPLMANFKAMMDNTDDYIYFKDRNHVFTGASQTLVSITDPSEHWTDLLGKTDYDVFPEEYADIYYRLEKQVFAGIHVAHEIQETIDNHGNKGWVDNRKYPIKNDQNEIVGLFGIARVITEQKLAEQALRKSEESLKESQVIAGLGSYVLDIQSGTWKSSEILDQILGIDETYERSEEGWDALIHPEDRPKAKNYLRRRFAKKCPSYDREYRIIRHCDKTERYIRGFGRLMLDSQGCPLHMYGTIQDVTDSRQELLAEKRAILGNKLIGIVTVRDRKVIWANSAFEAILGYDSGELVGKSTRDLYVNEAGYQAVGLVYDTLEAEGVANTQQELVKKDGQHVWVDMSAAILHHETGESLWAFVDITKRMQAENELRIAAIAFESQEGMMVTDAQNIILRVNRAFTNITGYSAEEAIGKPPSLLSAGLNDKAFYTDMWECINTNGSWEGEVWNRRKSGDVYPEHLTITTVKNANNTLTNYVATLTDITERKQAADQIEHLAFYDSLTHLPNRQLLLDRLNHGFAASARSDRKGALLFLDLDHFKTLNDTLGHDVGDLLLQQVAKRLISCVREGDTVARLGGDEFVVLLEDLSENPLEAAAQTELISEKILNALNQSYQLATYQYHVTTSIGVTLFSDHNQSQEELLKQADIAMYQAKKAGRNAIRFFDPKMQETINHRAALESELHQAIEGHQFQLYYQIQVDSAQQPLGAEALIRWIHPERGLVSPFHFIPLAEETGLILPIGLWVLETACAQLKLWEQDTRTRDLTISVNVSAKQFCHVDFVTQVQMTLQRYAVQPKRLKLELTESLLLENVESIVVSMIALETIGVQFSLDDFGTGYSSLQYLKMLPLNQLKIDQSFVRDLVTDSSDRSIVRTIIAMANSLGFEVIAEGVETEEQHHILVNKGCSRFQGYLFGRPVPIDAFEAVLKLGLQNG